MAADTSYSVGFIGLGNQGGPIARHIMEAGFPTTLWARRVESLSAFEGTAARVADSPAELASSSDVIGVCVWDDDGVTDVVLGDQGVLAGAAPGTIITIHSTVMPSTCVKIAEEASRRSVVVVDAPVSGGPEQSEAGTLLVMVGGDTRSVEYCRPMFETFSSHVLHLGEVGAGQLAKLVNNTLLTANVALAADALRLGVSIGLDEEVLLKMVTLGSSRSFAAGVLEHGRSDPDAARGILSYLDKDVHLLVDTARSHGARDATPVVDLAIAGLAELGRLSQSPNSDRT